MVTDEGTTSNNHSKPNKVYVLRRQADARDCGSNARTAAALGAAPKLDSKTLQ